MSTNIDQLSDSVTGYVHPSYAQSLSEYGTPRELLRSGSWVLERPIPGSTFRDAMGCYPVFDCREWGKLDKDLEDLKGEVVCLSIVSDPFGEYDEAYLRHCFRNVVFPFKQHFVVDLTRGMDAMHPHHRRNARKAMRELEVQRSTRPLDFLDEWTLLYSTLIERHAIRGIAAFSKESFARQLEVPGIVSFRAIHKGDTVGMLLWYARGGRAYYHLGAYNPRGYELGASFALFNYSIEYFANSGLRWLNLGAGAGAESGAESGLTRFKRGWSTGVRTAYFCGRIFDQKKYDQTVQARNAPPTNYFPAYRVGEFFLEQTDSRKSPSGRHDISESKS